MNDRSAAPSDKGPVSVGSIATPREGIVESFGDESGLGTVKDGAGRRFPFHCTSIADGSRTIAVGAAVEFVVAAGLKGDFEARQISRR